MSSPSFVLLQSYDCRVGDIAALHHVDLYRLAEDVADLREIGLEDTLSDPTAIVAVEWPKDTLATWIPADSRVWRIAITTEEDDSRRIEITPHPKFLSSQFQVTEFPSHRVQRSLEGGRINSKLENLKISGFSRAIQPSLHRPG